MSDAGPVSPSSCRNHPSADAETITSEDHQRLMYARFQSWALINYGETGKTKTVTRAKYERVRKILLGEEPATTGNSKLRFWVKAKGFQLGQKDRKKKTTNDALDDYDKQRDELDDDDLVLYIPTKLQVQQQEDEHDKILEATASSNVNIAAAGEERGRGSGAGGGKKAGESYGGKLEGGNLLRGGEGRGEEGEIEVGAGGAQESGELGGRERGAANVWTLKRVAIVEEFFDIIYNVHVEMDGRGGKHAGQKRTYRAIAQTYAFLPREAVTKFLMSCSDCQKRMHNTIDLPPLSKGQGQSQGGADDVRAVALSSERSNDGDMAIQRTILSSDLDQAKRSTDYQHGMLDIDSMPTITDFNQPITVSYLNFMKQRQRSVSQSAKVASTLNTRTFAEKRNRCQRARPPRKKYAITSHRSGASSQRAHSCTAVTSSKSSDHRLREAKSSQTLRESGSVSASRSPARLTTTSRILCSFRSFPYNNTITSLDSSNISTCNDLYEHGDKIKEGLDTEKDGDEEMTLPLDLSSTSTVHDATNVTCNEKEINDDRYCDIDDLMSHDMGRVRDRDDVNDKDEILSNIDDDTTRDNANHKKWKRAATQVHKLPDLVNNVGWMGEKYDDIRTITMDSETDRKLNQRKYVRRRPSKRIYSDFSQNRISFNEQNAVKTCIDAYALRKQKVTQQHLKTDHRDGRPSPNNTQFSSHHDDITGCLRTLFEETPMKADDDEETDQWTPTTSNQASSLEAMTKEEERVNTASDKMLEFGRICSELPAASESTLSPGISNFLARAGSKLNSDSFPCSVAGSYPINYDMYRTTAAPSTLSLNDTKSDIRSISHQQLGNNDGCSSSSESSVTSKQSFDDSYRRLLSVKQPHFMWRCCVSAGSGCEKSNLNQLIVGYRDSASFLRRCADELELLLERREFQ